jgi:hypothetical protein
MDEETLVTLLDTYQRQIVATQNYLDNLTREYVILTELYKSQQITPGE